MQSDSFDREQENVKDLPSLGIGSGSGADDWQRMLNMVSNDNSHVFTSAEDTGNVKGNSTEREKMNKLRQNYEHTLHKHTNSLEAQPIGTMQINSVKPPLN